MDILKTKKFLTFGAVIIFFASWVHPVSAAKLSLSPASGTFQVGSTFDVGVYLDTEGKSANVVEAGILFPADSLELVTPTLGQSVLSIWTSPPVFDNKKGTIGISGGIPGGLTVSKGLITNLTFRVKKASPAATVRFTTDGSVLENDGDGSNVLSGTQKAVYTLILPPPEGPIVASETDPDQSAWYKSSSASLHWANPTPVDAYSYSISQNPTEIPDTISEGKVTATTYSSLPDGRNYFHIRALRSGQWGTPSHFQINIDKQQPAEFAIGVYPSPRTSSRFQVLSFQTTDAYSGIDHYEMRIVNLTPTESGAGNGQQIFTEVTSPLSLSLTAGTYDITLRAYNKVGTYRQTTQRVHITDPVLGFITDSGLVFGAMTISWAMVAAIILGLALLYIGVIRMTRIRK